MEFDFTVTHRKGELNRNADFFSRWAAYKEWEEKEALRICLAKLLLPAHSGLESKDSEAIHCFAQEVVVPPLGLDPPPPQDLDNPDFAAFRKKIVEEQRKDPKLSKIIARLEATELVRASIEDELTQLDTPPESLQVTDLASISMRQEDDSQKEKVAAADHLAASPPVADGKSRQRKKPGSKHNFQLVGPDKLLVKECSYQARKQGKSVTLWPIVVPDSMIPTIMGLFHGDKSSMLHLGKHKTYGGAIRQRFTWKGMVQGISKWIGACHKCLRRKRHPPEHQRYNVHPSAVAPGNRICIDIVGPLEESKQGNTHILTIYDPFSHWPCVHIP